MIFNFGQFTLDIGAEKTAAFYRTLPPITEQCGCDDCRNYHEAVGTLSEEIQAFFSQLGIDIAKPTEVYVNDILADGRRFYGGFYHLCGRILQGKSAWVAEKETGECKLYAWRDENTASVTESFRISFQSECDMIEDSLPSPAIQLDFTAAIPWVLGLE